MSDLTLRRLRPEDEDAVRAIHEEFKKDNFKFLLFDGTWPEVLAAERKYTEGVNLPSHRVSADFFLAVRDDTIVGRVSIRHRLNDNLL
ncbi:hypothetical protein [Corynebacterium aquilae]|uniref:hypothetical protein n=1 Tax=Corynebacterium aquilae TaxID=203263 RepID=UPI001B80A03B|nr:hypothetical protein [Corynebacterium aquilae]